MRTLERTPLPRVRRPLQGLSDKDYIKGAVETALSYNCKVVVLHHTHKPKCIIDKGVTYVNAGTWVNGRSDYVYIDTIKKEIKIKKF